MKKEGWIICTITVLLTACVGVVNLYEQGQRRTQDVQIENLDKRIGDIEVARHLEAVPEDAARFGPDCNVYYIQATGSIYSKDDFVMVVKEYPFSDRKVAERMAAKLDESQPEYKHTVTTKPK